MLRVMKFDDANVRPLDVEITKRCSKCRNIQPRTNFVLDKNRKDGLHPQCRACKVTYRRNREMSDEQRQRRREYQRNYARRPERRQQILGYQKTETGRAVKARSKRKSRYGITEDQFQEMLRRQNSACACCLVPFVPEYHAQVDHCHATRKVRGLLCRPCNLALGFLGDNPAAMRALAAYVERAVCGD